MKAHLSRRIERLQTKMDAAGLDAVIFTDRENLVYYTGAVEIECMGVVIPASGEAVVCCLWLDEAYVRECSGSERVTAYHFPTSNIGAAIVQSLRGLGLTRHRVGFHKYFVEFAVFSALKEAFPAIEWRPAMDLTYKVRAVKSEEELACIGEACSFLDIGMRAACDVVLPGMTEVEVLAEADYAMRKAGSEGSTFRMQVLTWAKQLQAHPYAGSTVIDNNQPVVIHLGASCRGYTAKMCRTVFLGDVPEETLRVYDILTHALGAGVSALKPGAITDAVYATIFTVVKNAGYGPHFLDHVGYGVGIRQTEFYPIIGKGLDHEVQENMVVDLLLPTIYVPGVGGPRVTDTIRVAASGGEYMTSFTREIVHK